MLWLPSLHRQPDQVKIFLIQPALYKTFPSKHMLNKRNPVVWFHTVQESLSALIQNWREKDRYGREEKIHSNMIRTELIDIDVCVCSNVVNSPAFPANGPMDDTNTL